MSFTTCQKTTDGREYVAVFDDPHSTTPTRRYVYAPDGRLESSSEDLRYMGQQPDPGPERAPLRWTQTN